MKNKVAALLMLLGFLGHAQINYMMEDVETEGGDTNIKPEQDKLAPEEQRKQRAAQEHNQRSTLTPITQRVKTREAYIATQPKSNFKIISTNDPERRTNAANRTNTAIRTLAENNETIKALQHQALNENGTIENGRLGISHNNILTKNPRFDISITNIGQSIDQFTNYVLDINTAEQHLSALIENCDNALNMIAKNSADSLINTQLVTDAKERQAIITAIKNKGLA